MKSIIIRAAISLVLLIISACVSFVSEYLKLPILLVIGFIISQCVNECISYYQLEKLKDIHDGKINKKQKVIEELQSRIRTHYSELDDLCDLMGGEVKYKKQIKSLKKNVFNSVGYGGDDRELGSHKQNYEKKEKQFDVNT
ncbi:hypothetical protein [Morganella morganii]|uniref:hypothetical protein n=1 Tax=Morganella morganii TaxID=582 RepID=UPI000699FD43|nr:hypothetical protein [Morganella morganii]KNZ84893.1 hypothetical protein AKG16_17825 [Morganella morganii]HCR4033746.1 hypothetical protein [Morganella morganii]